jgi:glucose-6-phosphate isomerase
MTIEIDYNFCLKEIIGEQGISFDEIFKYQEKVNEIHKKILNDKKDKVGFYSLPFQNIYEIKKISENFQDKFDNCVVLGIGGSALGTIAVKRALYPFYGSNEKNLYIIDNIDPEVFNEFLEFIDFKKTFFVIISKSGSTAETISQFLIIRQILIKKFMNKGYKERVVVITDPFKGTLREIVNKEGLTSFDIPENVGGRFSVLTPVGLFPLAFINIDISNLLNGAKECFYKTDNSILPENISYLSGLIHYLAYKNKKSINVLMPYSSKLYDFADWFRQLWAESLGKQGFGPTPVKALGSTDQHSQLQLYIDGPKDKLITFIKVKNFNHDMEVPPQEIDLNYEYLFNHKMGNIINSEIDSTRVALAKKGVLNYTIILDKINAFNLGWLIFYFEAMTHFTGYLFGINPFDQPGVELSKQFTYGLLGRNGFENKKREFENFFCKSSKKFIVSGEN